MRTPILIATLVLLLATTTRSADTTGNSGVVHASADHEIKLKPQKLRLTMMVRAEGADAKSALASFIEHKARVKKELLEMKADEASIEVTTPLLTDNQSASSEEWTSYSPGRVYTQHISTGPSQSSEAGATPKIYVATGALKAEWPLPTADADALALLPETLKDQVVARDLMGKKNKAKLDKTQQEKLEELQAAQQSSSYQSSPEGLPLSAVFAAKVDDDARKQAIKAAYDKAVAQTQMLATVTGHKLGALKALNCDENAATNSHDVYQAAASYPGSGQFTSAEGFALNPDPGELRVNVRVFVEFALADEATR